MPKGMFEELIGNRYGNLVVVEHLNKTGKTKSKCLCDCGNEVVVANGNLKDGHTISCGCHRKSVMAKLATTHGNTVDRAKKYEYSVWEHIKASLKYPTNASYEYYGGKGIGICAEWEFDFEQFLKDVGKCPGANMILGRIDLQKGYEPGNCKWTTQLNQNRKKGIYRNNTSGQKGVSWDRRKQKWRVTLGMNGKQLYIGDFHDLEDAVNARKSAEERYWEVKDL